jgi:hypothetical protein
MNEYLEFTEFDDKTYSEELQNIEDQYTIVGSAARALFRRDSDKLKYTNREYRRSKMGQEGSSGSKTVNSILGTGKRLAMRYRHHRDLDAQKKRTKYKEGYKKFMKKNPTANMSPAEAAAYERTEKEKSKGKWTKAGSTVGGAAIGSGAAYLATSKWRKELAALKVKPNPTPEDEAKIKTLKRKITGATAAGGVLGGAAGYAGSHYYVKNKLKKASKPKKKS